MRSDINSFKFLKMKRSEKSLLISNLGKYYDADTSNLEVFDFYRGGKDKVIITTVPEKELSKLEKVFNFGLYFGTFHDGGRLRLSVEGCRFIVPKKNFVVLNEKSFNEFIAGENLFQSEIADLNFDGKAPFLIVKYGAENLGVVFLKDGVFTNYLSKSRKLNHNKVF